MRPLLFLLLAAVATAAPAPPDPTTVAMIYNRSQPASRELAEDYARKRNIPADNLIGLDMPAAAEISRAEYNNSIAKPLRAEFDRRSWWKRARNSDNVFLPVENRIRILVTLRGVPLKIKREPKPAPPPPEPGAPAPPAPTPEQMLAEADEASVDSELALLGVDNVPIRSAVPNKYAEADKPFASSALPFMMLVGRIDAHDDATCRRMINDALATEDTGLWGRAYIDIAKKIPQGDAWLEQIATASRNAGFPTIVDRFPDTYPTNYPMTEAAVYFGWYAWNADGPLLNPSFRFRRGAVAVHLHSFSAAQLADPKQNWCAPLLAHGAAATVGNVYEPFLHLSHNLATFYRRLLDGFTLVEAAWMAMPVCSWQGIVLGDPLYRPFLHLDGTGNKVPADRDFRALRLATMEWKDDPANWRSKLANAAKNLSSGTIFEALGLQALEGGDTKAADEWFNEAKAVYTDPGDRIRMDLHRIAILRNSGNKAAAITELRSLKTRFSSLPEASAITAWLTILDPPPPPPADPNKQPKNPPK